MMTNATVSPRFLRIAAWVREHGNACTTGANPQTGCEFVDIEVVLVDREKNVTTTTERAYSKVGAARILGY